jgi:hypothetical protein
MATVLSSGIVCATKLAELTNSITKSKVDRQYFAGKEYINHQSYMVRIGRCRLTISDYEPPNVNDLTAKDQLG